MTVDDVRPLLDRRIGLFVGGSTLWKETTLCDWGTLGNESGCLVHVGRVNPVRRINLCIRAGAHSFDGERLTIR